MSNRSALSRKLLLASTSALSFVITVPVFAQQASGGGELQEVVVTGFRQSLQNALDNKRTSDLPIESVAPEDIGKMPDQNVAEALQRLPGIQIGRDATGAGTQVLIDGLRQNLTTLNGDVFLSGKEFYVSGENSGGGAGAGAQYGSLEGIPSEEIGGIDVYKNPKASMTEGGLGGTINLKTRDPLAQPVGWTLGGNFRMTSSENQGDWTPNGTVVGSYNFNNRLAITASFSYDDEKSKTQEFEDANRSGWIITNSATPPYVGTLTPAGITNLGKFYIDPQLAYFSDIEEERKVYGASLGVAAKLSDSLKTRVNWFYSHEDDVSLDYSDKVGFNGSGQPAGAKIPGIDPTQAYSIDGNGVVQNGTFASTGAETATLYQHGISESNNVQWLTEYNSGGAWRGDIDASYAYSTSDYEAAQADIEHGYYTAFTGAPTAPTAPGCNNFAPTCTAGQGNHGYVFNWTNGGTSGLPTVNYPTDVLTNPNYVLFKSNWAWANLTSQQQFAIKGDVEYDPPFIKGIDTTITAGVRYGDRNVGQTFGRYLINGVDSTGKALANCCQDPNGGTWIYYSDPGYANIPFSTALSNPGLVKTVNIKGVGNVVVKDPNSGGLTNPSTYLNTVWKGAGVANSSERFFADGLSSFSVQEHTYAAYLMGDMGGQMNRFHVNYGVRFIQTDLDIHNGQSAAVPTYYGTASWNGVDSNVVPVTTSRSYSDVLPSLNFVLDASDTEKVRFGAARVVSPQDLFALGAGNLYNFSRETNGRTNIHTGVKDGFAFFNGTSGNTQLDPYRASQALLSYENYFARGGLIQIGGFYKQVDNFVETQNVPTFVMDDFGGTTNNVSKPVNAGKGQIYGAEIGGQYNFDDKWNRWLDGFGVAANYTRSMSVSEQPTSFQSQGQIPGVAKNALTATLFYEKNGLSVRGSYSWQDVSVSNGGFGSTFAFNDQNGNSKTYTVYQAPYGELDGQISYDINEHFGVVFSVQNLTDAAQHTYLQWKNLPFTYDDVGRRFFLGGKFKL